MSDERTLVLGVGNILWADEGFGVRAVEDLERGYAFAGDIAFMDGGTRGLALLDPIAEADRLLLLDAVVFGGAPGEVRRVTGSDVPRFIGQKAVSLHQTGMQEILAVADLQGRLPSEVVLIGVEPLIFEDYGGGLSDRVAASLPYALDLAVRDLRAWGHTPAPRITPKAEASINVHALQRAAYETGRPPADLACRTGDDRFLPRQI